VTATVRTVFPDTLWKIAHLHETSVEALVTANAQRPTNEIFADEIRVPKIHVTSRGDTLASIANANRISVPDLAMANAYVAFRAGIDIPAPERLSPPMETFNTLDDIASSMKASIAAIAEANAETRGLLAPGAPLVVDGVTVKVTADMSILDVAEALRATPAKIAAQNAKVEDIFQRDQRVVVRDYVLQSGDSFFTLWQQNVAWTIPVIADHARDTPDLFEVGVALFVRIAAKLEPSSDTLDQIARAAGVGIEQLAIANSATSLKHNGTLLTA